VHALIAAGGSDWSYGGAILTFAFPMILFIFVAGTLWVLYTMPHMVPGHRYQSVGSPVSRAPAAGQARATDSSPETGPGGQPGGTEG
jgi:hypothetical protein